MKAGAGEYYMGRVKTTISIVIPVYNTNRMRLERCIESVLAQEYQKFEIVVVDDGSSCDNVEFIREICERDLRIILYTQENQGSGAARNLGVSKAKGDYILFLDSDDILSEYALGDAIQCLNQTEADMVVGQIHKEKETERRKTFFEKAPLESTLLSTGNDIKEYINHIMGCQSDRFFYEGCYFCDGPVAKLCRRDLLLQCQFDTQKFWGEDTIWNLRFAKICKNIAVSNNVWYYALANSDSQTHVFRPDCEYEFKYRIQQEREIMIELWPDCMDGLYAQIWLSTYYIFMCYLLHENNNKSFIQRYKMFLRCIKEPAYKMMLENITFKDEECSYKRIVKKMIRNFSIYGPKFFAYVGWTAILKNKKGER